MTTYKLQYREEKDENGTVIYDLYVDGIHWRSGDYIEQTKIIYKGIHKEDTYQEAKSNGRVYHQSTGKEFREIVEKNSYGIYSDIL